MGAAQNIIKLALTVVFFQIFGASLSWLVWAFLLSYVAAMVIFAPQILRNYARIPSSGETLPLRDLVREIAPFGLVLSLTQFFSTMISYSDRVILGYLLPTASASGAIAIYALAVTLAMNILVFPGAVGGIFMPLISRLVGIGDMESVRKVMGTVQRWTLFLTLPFAVVMIAFSGEMLAVLYGQSYSGGATVMSIFVLGMFFSFFTQVIAIALAGMRLVNLEFKIILTTGILNVIFNFILVPILGIEGSALASAVSFALSAVLFCHYGWKLIKFKMPGEAYRMIFAGIATLAVLFLLKPIVLSIAYAVPSVGSGEIGVYLTKGIRFGFIGMIAAFSGAAFVLFCLFLKCFEHEDIAVMRKAAKKAKMPETLTGLAEKIILYGVPAEKS
ncbi:MAG: polysaccharide biosynthesis C-terminal domain-containing protein [Candidatus Anstonellaceae archaeon]